VPDPPLSTYIHCLTSWLDRCSKTHGACIRAKSSRLPTRVLDLGTPNSDKTCLREASEIEEQSEKYIALSHCWGASQTCTTTNSTISERKQNISLDSLPPNFQDAVKITKGLGIRYLWIDSLCIIQDNILDWEKESHNMAYVYSNAYLTIAASNASSSCQSFLHQRSPKGLRASFESTDSAGKMHTVYIDSHVRHRNLDSRHFLDGEPLSLRGWAMQERFLSHCVAFYTSTQLFWECQEICATEDGQCNKNLDYLVLMDDIRMRKPNYRISRPFRTYNITRLEDYDIRDYANFLLQIYKKWYHMIELYSGLNLTRYTDKLPAVSGLADTIARMTDDRYCAGLWCLSIQHGILWSRVPRARSNETYGPEVYRAPSFSWESVEGPVTFRRYNALACKPIYEAKYIDHNIECRGADPYGEVLGGSVRIEAPIYEITRYLFHSYASGGKHRIIEFNINDRVLGVDCYLDHEGSNALKRGMVPPFSALIVVVESGTNRAFGRFEKLLGLLLQATGPDRSQFRRVGLIAGRPLDLTSIQVPPNNLLPADTPILTPFTINYKSLPNAEITLI
jgi:hypothetical protein